LPDSSLGNEDIQRSNTGIDASKWQAVVTEGLQLECNAISRAGKGSVRLRNGVKAGAALTGDCATSRVS
jgi:hypothetical protein